MSRAKILESLNVNELSREIREINETNGWRTTKPFEWEDTYKVPAILALIHSEISEAWEAAQDELGPAFSEELADVAIRILDMAEGLGIEIGGPFPVELADLEHWDRTLDDDLNRTHFVVSKALEFFRADNIAGFTGCVSLALECVADICVACGVDLAAEIKAKLAKNRNRGYRHGNKRV